MRFHNRLADCQPHAHPLGFGRIESVEQLGFVARGDSLAAVANGSLDRAVVQHTHEYDAEQIAAQSTENPDLRTDPESLAHLIYSSGSTGRRLSGTSSG